MVLEVGRQHQEKKTNESVRQSWRSIATNLHPENGSGLIDSLTKDVFPQHQALFRLMMNITEMSN